MRRPLACKIKEVLELRKTCGLLNLIICAAVGVALLLPCYTLANERQDLIVSKKTFVLSEQEKLFIKSIPPLKVMIDDNFVPLSFYDSKTNSYQGISVDLFRHMADSLGLKYQLIHDKSLSWSRKVDLFKNHKIDLLMPVSFTEERASVGIFTANFYSTYYGVIAKKTNNVKNRNTYDLANYKVGVTKASAILPFVQKFVPANRLVQYDNQTELYQGVKNNQIDVALQNKDVFLDDRFNLGFVDLIVVHTILESPRRYAYYLDKTDQDEKLASIMDRYLRVVDFSQLLAKYEQREELLIMGYIEQKHQRELLILGIIVSFALLVLIAIVYLNHRRFAAKLAVSLEQLQHQKKKLQKSEEKYRSLFDNTRDALIVLESPPWRVASGNQATVAMFRARDKAQLLSYLPWELSPTRQPDGCNSVAKAFEMIETALREGYCLFEWTHRRIDGEEFPADVLLTLVKDDERVIMDGYELFLELKQLKPDLPIIVSSGFGEGEVLARISLHDRVHFVSKPYNADQFREVLRSVVGSVASA